MTRLDEVLGRFPIPEEVRPSLEAALMEREDDMADQLRIAGAQFGAMPEFVAEVLVQIELGTPPSSEARVMIRQGFETRLAWLQEEYRRMTGGEPPDTEAPPHPDN